MTQSSGCQLSETEARVAKILQTALPGVRIVPIDPGGGPQQRHDFNLVDSAGSVEALEVTEATVASLRSASATRAKKLSSGAVPTPGLRRKWHLIPTEQTPFDQLDKAIPLVVQIESKIQADGLASWTEHPEAQRLMTDFRLAYARPWGETSDPMLVVGRPADLTVWVENPGDPGYWVQQVVRDEANKDDNRGSSLRPAPRSGTCSFGSMSTTTCRGKTSIRNACRPPSRPCRRRSARYGWRPARRAVAA
jgi:hypothetical protein